MIEISNFLPHSGVMVMIDEILSFDESQIIVQSTISAQSPFVREGRFATHQIIEMMAQSLGIYDHKMRELRGMEQQLGFLLGSRKFEIYRPFLDVGERIIITSRPSMQDASGFGIYESSASVNGTVIARARLNVYSPDKEFLQGLING